MNANRKRAPSHKRLRQLWATGKATKAQMLRCMELDRIASAAAVSRDLDRALHGRIAGPRSERELRSALAEVACMHGMAF